MRPIHILPFGPRSGPDHRIGASRCGCDPLAAEVIGEGPSGPVVWIHRPIHEPVGSRVGSERQPDRATGPAGITQPVKGATSMSVIRDEQGRIAAIVDEPVQ